jgi:16S rRNA (uracil1498-N3)-methyltransferase
VFWCDRSLLDGDRVKLTGAEGRHATTVRRLRPGERVNLTDGAGLIAECEVVAARPGPGELDLAVVARRTEPEPLTPVTVVQAILKGDRGELAVELMTEVGADVIVPWAAGRCVARWAAGREDKALAKWRSAAVAAGKQARRGRFSDVRPQERLAGITRLVSEAALAVLLDPAADKPLAGLPLPAAGEIVLIVGPEGGLTEAEDSALTAAGAVRARLGPTVLRGSTAGAVATALVLSTSGRWA